MAVDLMKSGVAVGVGILDEFMNSWDAKATPARTKSFKNATDISRLIVAGTGYAIQAFYPRYSRIGEAMAISGTTLLVKSIAKPLRDTMGTPSAMDYTTRMAVPVQPAMAIPIERSYDPEFESTRVL